MMMIGTTTAAAIDGLPSLSEERAGATPGPLYLCRPVSIGPALDESLRPVFRLFTLTRVVMNFRVRTG